MDALKAQLKAFERSFREEHGREPTKADIKARPDVSDMYKSYNRVKAGMKAPKEVEDPFAAPSAAPVASTSRKSAPAAATAPPASAPASAFATPKKPAYTGGSMDVDMVVEANGVTYEQANSPARLRQLISKATFSPQRVKHHSLSPVKRAQAASLLEPRDDSPRTKARKWLGGSSGLTPKRSRSSLANGRAERSSSRDVSAEPPSQPFEPMETSPVKPGPDGRAYQPMFDDEETAPAPTLVQSKLVFGRKPAAPVGDVQPSMPAPAPIRKPVKRPSEGKTNGLAPPRPTKRAKSAEASVVPNDYVPSPAVTSAAVVPKLFDADDADEVEAAPRSPRRRRRRRTPADTSEDMNAEADGEEDSDGSSVSDERLVYHRRPVDEVEPEAPPEVVEDPLDEHADLVSALSLRASPTRKHRQAVAARKARLFAQVLGEPSVLAEARLGRAAGLEELAGLNEEGVGGSEDEAGEEGEDDDWASEPEGWKELGGVEMDGLGETLE